MKKPKGWIPDTYYKLGDRHPAQGKFGVYLPSVDYAPMPKNGKHVKAIWGGEYREPKKGEWYLSGCEGFVTAYRAPNDLSYEYFIAKIVEVETKTWTTTKTIRPLENS